MTTIAAVSYLNARPLIDGLDQHPDLTVVRRVPSRLLETLVSGEADIALCPVIDYQRSALELEIVPGGAIGCEGPALTVKLFSRVPASRVREVAIDGDSHTSMALLQVALADVGNHQPDLRPLDPSGDPGDVDGVLLIGDKVITSPPQPEIFPFGSDLGQLWWDLTGDPFVFAVWMIRAGTRLGDLPSRLEKLRRDNLRRLDDIAHRHGRVGGWPADLAKTYLSRNLRYDLGARELAAIELFWRRCHELGIIDELRPLRLYEA